MSGEITARDEAELDSFLARRSTLSDDYKVFEPIEPPEALDARVLAGARAAAAPPAAKAAAASPESSVPAAAPVAAATRTESRPAAKPCTVVRRDADTDDDDEELPPARRRRWWIPAMLAAAVLVATGLMLFNNGTDFDPGASSPLDLRFARRARERVAADKAAAAAAAQEAEAAALELAPLPPPPFFGATGPQVEDLEATIALVRRELVRASQAAAMAQAAAPSVQGVPDVTAAEVTSPADAAVADVVQPRDRRLAKILELYDGGNPDLAADSLEIFLRDFADAPISQQIMDAQPRAADVAVE